MAWPFGFTIDLIAKNPHQSCYDLILFDKPKTNDPERHFHQILKRAKQYADFVESGQFAKKYPESKGHRVRLCIISNVPQDNKIKQLAFIRSHDSDTFELPVVVQSKEQYFEENKKRGSPT